MKLSRLIKKQLFHVRLLKILIISNINNLLQVGEKVKNLFTKKLSDNSIERGLSQSFR